ncbi:ArsR family transcriptional regulator [Hymenobacter luteus]|uniref:ArsR family transcriptional regulator n=2 Tax=Hymenobacter TaxID=89966 RepID=A0A7W9WBP5_9BACT|nr:MULTISPECIES: metalloregulator ArsR/SmtB family transcription factor [Hymenobacter]MBB4599828.1 ArsR family transcriptional regulator [Hymenobacter latericoloratus]MBB6057862.1 ArsR family transcriptional regulator [Hymenobacter luteus]
MTPTTATADLNLTTERMEKVAFILKTTAHPTRIAIVQLLANQESLSVSDISEKLGVEQSLLSHHLTGMKLKGILDSSRAGKNIFYSLKMREVVDVIQCLAACTFL